MSNPKDLVGAKKAPLRYVPAALVIEASGPMEDGAIKYGPFNWRDIPVELMTYIEAVQRHLAAFVDGQDNAEDSGHSHIGHAIAGLGIIADAKANGTLIDNRPTKGPAADMLRARDKSAKPADTFSDDPCMQRGLDGGNVGDSVGDALRAMAKENPSLFPDTCICDPSARQSAHGEHNSRCPMFRPGA